MGSNHKETNGGKSEYPDISRKPIEPEGWSIFKRGKKQDAKPEKRGGFLWSCCLTSCTLFLGLSLLLILLSYHLMKDLFSKDALISRSMPVPAVTKEEAMTKLIRSINVIEDGEAERFTLELSELEFNSLMEAEGDVAQWFYLQEGGLRYVASYLVGKRWYLNLDVDSDVEVKDHKLNLHIHYIHVGDISLPEFLLDLLSSELSTEWNFEWRGINLEDIIKEATFHNKRVIMILSK